ncbi:YciI family protein [Cohnella faecalis]|uniref:YCII-related domain-containing protein n=1 Tax=Cohnella faecalis TaxID=2315694 RepID=A0A398CYX9_9BACL|nr:YciI family protein [Cohnella faecalis]RIE05047.1 hypothetical protein D3H35_02615 [Cohnella faecalis]
MADFIVELPVLDASKAEKHLKAHIEFLDRLRESGVVLANGRFADGSGGLVIYRGESRESVQELVERDPFVANGVRSYIIREWLAKWGAGPSAARDLSGH